MRECPACGGPVEATFRYCPWCAAPQRLKIVEFFRAHAPIEADAGKALRVSRYLGAEEAERHVRFSVWNRAARVEGAVSLGEDEAARLARFLADVPPPRQPARPRSLLGQLALRCRL
jgi:hypothetical protein